MSDRIWIVAAKEWRDGWRNRWVLGVTVLFTLLAVSITWFGSAVNAQAGTLPLAATIASLSSLTVLVVPLIALLLGFDAFVGEQEQGTLLLLLTYPVRKYELVLGKFFGQLAILSLATLIGFGSAAVLLAIEGLSSEMLLAFVRFISSAILLGAVFLALSHCLSLCVSEKARAAGLALLVWFVLTLLYDLSLLALLVTSQGWLSESLLQTLLFLNPTDLFRLINLQGLQTEGAGVLASVGQMQFSQFGLYFALVGWAALCLLMSTLRFNRKRI